MTCLLRSPVRTRRFQNALIDHRNGECIQTAWSSAGSIGSCIRKHPRWETRGRPQRSVPCHASSFSPACPSPRFPRRRSPCGLRPATPDRPSAPTAQPRARCLGSWCRRLDSRTHATPSTPMCACSASNFPAAKRHECVHRTNGHRVHRRPRRRRPERLGAGSRPVR